MSDDDLMKLSRLAVLAPLFTLLAGACGDDAPTTAPNARPAGSGGTKAAAGAAGTSGRAGAGVTAGGTGATSGAGGMGTAGKGGQAAAGAPPAGAGGTGNVSGGAGGKVGGAGGKVGGAGGKVGGAGKDGGAGTDGGTAGKSGGAGTDGNAGTGGAGTDGGAAGKSGGGGTSPLPKICSCYSGDGPYCASGVAAAEKERNCQVPALDGNGNDLLQCQDGKWSLKKSCDAGCNPGQPGETDACELPACDCFVKDAWCGSGAAKEGLSKSPPCRVPLVPEHNDDILGCKGTAWVVKQSCDKGCIEAPKGMADSCKSDSSYKTPWACGTTEQCTQANNGSSHQGTQFYAWDFGLAKETPVHAARGGTVKYLEIRSPPGSACFDPPGLVDACHNRMNFIGIKHSDGTVALYMHLRTFTVKKGDTVKQGQKIGVSGNSGYTSGPHLHFQLQNDCGIWYCQSVPVKFADAPGLQKLDNVKSANCP